MEKIKICITGANGFVGKNLLNRLKDRNDIITIPFEGDITHIKKVEFFFNTNKNIDQLIHLAGKKHDNGNPNIFSQVNAEGTKNLLEACKKYKIKKIILASTGAVYGGPKDKKKSNENDDLYPKDLYSSSKILAERYITDYAKECGLKYIILRFSNIYGPSGDSVINIFIDGIKSGNSISIVGDGSQKRDFLFINDAVEAICGAIDYNNSNEFINIAGEKNYSLNDIIKILRKNKFDFSLEYSEGRGRVQDLILNINKAWKILKWKPKITAEQGIKIIINDKIKK